MNNFPRRAFVTSDGVQLSYIRQGSAPEQRLRQPEPNEAPRLPTFGVPLEDLVNMVSKLSKLSVRSRKAWAFLFEGGSRQVAHWDN